MRRPGRSPRTVLAAFCLLAVFQNAVASQSPIKHLIVQMNENRSFDHLLGMMSQLNPEILGISANTSNPLDPFDPNSERVFVTFDGDGWATPDAGHSFNETMTHMYGATNFSSWPSNPTMDGFVYSATQMGIPPADVMQVVNLQWIPVLSTLVSSFGVVDRYFSSIPGPTYVNRAYMYSGSSGGWDDEFPDALLAEGLAWPSIFPSLLAANISFKVYMADGVSAAMFFKDVRTVEILEHFATLDRYYEDCANGTLPQVAFVCPRYFSVTGFPATDMHPAHSVTYGEQMLRDVYIALRASPQWLESAMLLVYDEHGGLIDTQPPPTQGVPNPDGLNATDFDFTILGPRVPALLISPWIDAGTVVHEPVNPPTPTSQFEHTAVLATIHELFGTQPLTRRDAWAPSFLPLFNRTTPRTDCPADLPVPPIPPAHAHRRLWSEPLSDLQQSFAAAAAAIAGLENPSQYRSAFATQGEAGAWVEDVMMQWRARVFADAGRSLPK